MKKFLSLLLALAVCISLVACNGKKTKEDLLSEAIVLSPEQLINEKFDNPARAKKEYHDKIVKMTGEIFDIDDDYIAIGFKRNGIPSTSIYVLLDSNSIAELEKNTEITIVGKMSVDGSGSGFTNAPCILDAYLVE